jgi:hypothetical protein
MTSNLTVKIGADIAGLQKELKRAESSLSGFNKSMDGIKGAIMGAFAGVSLGAVASFTFEISKLSGEAEGVSAAFNRLPNNIKLMDDLKRATGGTVSELDLMKRAVQANNFDIELSSLPRLLQFATLRAQQTGQSVDYLVDSIVMGIGRKSKLILDNLGISAVALGEKLNGVSAEASTVGQVAEAVGQIAQESLEGMAGFSENASTKVQRLAASWENAKVAMGDAANSSGLLGNSIDALGASLDVVSAKQITFSDKMLALFGGAFALSNAAVDISIKKHQELVAEQKRNEQVIREVDHAFKEFNGNLEAYSKAIETHILRTQLLDEFKKRMVTSTTEQIVTLESLKGTLKDLNEQFEQTNVNDSKKLNNLATEIIRVQALIDKYEALMKAQSLSSTSKKALGETKSLTSTVSPKNTLGTSIDVQAPSIVNAFNAIDNAAEKSGENLKNWAAAASISHQMVIDKMTQQADAAVAVSDITGNALSNALSGQQSGVQALAQATSSIVDLFYKQAVAAAIAKAIQSGGPLPLGLIAAGVGIAAVKGMFAKIGGGGGGAGASGSGGSNNGGLSTRKAIGSRDKRDMVAIMPPGEWKVEGRALKYILDKENALDSKRKG